MNEMGYMSTPILEQSITCIACGEAIKKVHSWVDRCSSCGLEVSSLGPGIGSDGFDGLESLRRKNFGEILSLLAGSAPSSGGRLLEIGCAHGWFLETSRDHGFTVVGVEPGEYEHRARAKGFEVLSDLFPKATSHLANGSFDVIAFNDVLEHLPNPKEALGECDRLLADGGKIVINIPVNSGFVYLASKALRLLGWHGPYDRLWQKGFSSPHLFYFSEKSLRQLLSSTIEYKMCKSRGLRSTQFSGLWKRVNIGAKGNFQAVILYIMSVGFSSLEIILPPDIKVFIFEKNGFSGDPD